MAVDIFIKFEGGVPINGESQVEGFKGQVEASSFSEGFHNPKDLTGKGHTASRTNVSDIQISSAVGKHSEDLKKAMFENKKFDKVTVFATIMEGTQVVPKHVRVYEGVYVTSYSSSKANEQVGFESWSFAPTKIHGAYLEQDPNTNALTEAATSNLNIAESKTE